MSLDDLYREVILEHARSPHRVGLREPFTAEVYQVNPTCGDEVTLRVALAGQGPAARLEDVSYQPQGCSISVASASVMAERVTGLSVEQALAAYADFHALVTARRDPLASTTGSADPPGAPAELGDDDSAAFAGVSRFPARVKCALLGWTALREALARAAGA